MTKNTTELGALH